MQCGAKRSTCADCHDVSTSGSWHRDHAFADLCAACHQGQPEATTEAEAHRGLIDPRESCRSCHTASVTYEVTPAAPPPPPKTSSVAPNLIAAIVAVVLGFVLVGTWRKS